MIEPTDRESIKELTRLAKEWREAIRHDAVGMGSATSRSLAVVDACKEHFQRKLAQARPQDIADLLIQVDNSLLTEKSSG
jgi:hypothetical protein